MTIKRTAKVWRTTPLLPRVVRAQVEKGDVVVIECPTPLAAADRQRYTVALKALWPKNKILILDKGITLKIGTPMEPNTR